MLIDLLLPRTDLGALVQLILTLVICAPVTFFLWRRGQTEAVWLVVGIAVLMLGFFALRTVH